MRSNLMYRDLTGSSLTRRIGLPRDVSAYWRGRTVDCRNHQQIASLGSGNLVCIRPYIGLQNGIRRSGIAFSNLGDRFAGDHSMQAPIRTMDLRDALDGSQGRSGGVLGYAQFVASGRQG